MAGDYPALHRLEGAIQPLTANLTGPFYVTVIGTVNTVGGGTGGTSSIDEAAFTTGGTSLTPMGAINLGIGGQATASMNTGQVGAPRMSGQRILFIAPTTPSGGDITDNTNTALRVNVVAGGAGGGVANLTVRGTANTDIQVGYASGAAGAWPNTAGNAWLPVFFPSGFYPTVNTSGGGFASVGVFGSVQVVGSVNITGSINPVGIFGSLGAGSLNVLAGQAGAPWSVTGSQAVTPATSFITVRGTANTDIQVGYASGAVGAWPNTAGNAWLPVFFPSGFYPTVNTSGGGFASVGVFGSVSITGSVNITGSINPVGVFGSLGALTGTVALSNIPTVWYGGIGADTVNSAVRVNVVAGGAGGGVANITVRGTANTDIQVGYASGAAGAWPNTAGNAWLPVFFPSGFYPTVNTSGGGFASVGVFGSVLVTGSVNITGSINPVGVFGSLGAGSLNVLAGQAGAPWSVTGSVNTTPQGVQAVDTRGSLTATQWIISSLASGQFQVVGSAPASQRAFITSFHVTATGTIDYQWQSPSGVAVSGSMRLLPGAGFGLAGNFPAGPVVIGSQSSGIYILTAGTQNYGGIAVGYVSA